MDRPLGNRQGRRSTTPLQPVLQPLESGPPFPPHDQLAVQRARVRQLRCAGHNLRERSPQLSAAF
ncbi:ribonuclease VapC [Streptomyces azureus]|uniref:Ribonuclease VapC n=1 Tax=Streptomyces azureus TaxID=146537 RepID=A0A0K8PUX6_STRAJ|nr:ribonuclease VapC [Streptomyces azureus]